MIPRLALFLLLIVSSTLSAAQFSEWPAQPSLIGNNQTQYLAITLQNFTDYPNSNNFHEGAPFTLAQLDSDAAPEILVKSYASGQPGARGVTLYAFDSDGSALWSRYLGYNTFTYGSWSPALAYDLDGDGLDEIYSYYWPTGSSCQLARISPTTGAIEAQTAWPAGDIMTAGNLYWRGSLLLANLDGINTSLVAITGYLDGKGHYVKAVDASLQTVASYANNTGIYRQGSHQYIAGDLIGDDGRDEILFGSWYLKWETSTGLSVGDTISLSNHSHCDALQLSDFDPNRPGYEIWLGSDDGAYTGLLDANLNWIWQLGHGQQAQSTYGDLLPNQPGWETAFDYGGEHGEPPLLNRRIAYADGSVKTFAELGLDELSVEHHNLSSDFVHWNVDYSVVLQEEIPGLMASLEQQPLFRVKGDYFDDGREEVLIMDGNKLKIFAATGSAWSRPSHFRDDRKYRFEQARGSRHFAAFHYTAPLPLVFLPTASNPGNNAPSITSLSATANPVSSTSTSLEVIATDQDNDVLSYNWSVVGPTGSNTLIENGTSNSPQLLFTMAGAYTVSVIVSDGNGGSASDNLLIDVIQVQSVIEID